MRSLPGPSAQARQVISELDELCVIDRLKSFEHDRLIGVPRPALVLAQGFQQVIFALAGQPRHGLLPGKIGTVTHIAVVLFGQPTGPFKARRIAGIVRRRRRRQGACSKE